MDPELKEYFDAWFAKRERDFDNLMALMGVFPSPTGHSNSTPVITTDGVVAPAPAGTAELVTASVGLAEAPTTVPIVEESLAVTPAAPIDTIDILPTTCSTDCVAQATTTSTALLPWASMPSASPSSPGTSMTNGMVSNELAPDNDGQPIKGVTSMAPTPTSEKSPVVTQAAANDTITVAPMFCSTECATQVVTAPSSTRTTTTPPLLWASGSSSSHASPARFTTNEVISTELAPDKDDSEHGVSLTVAPVLSSKFGVPVMLSTSSTTEIVLTATPVGIPWALTMSWLEPVPLRPPDPWSLSRGAWSDSRPEASITVQSDVNTVLLCNDTKEVSACVLSDEVPQLDKVHQQPWPPWEIEVLCSIDSNSCQLTNTGFEVSICPVRLISEIPMDVLVTCSVVEVLSRGCAPSFLRIYLVKEENQNTPCICGVIPGAITYGPDHFQWEIAWFLAESPCAHIKFGRSGKLTVSDSVPSTDKWQLQSVACSLKTSIQRVAALYLEDLAATAAVSPHDCSLGVYYCHGDIFVGCMSTCFSPVLLLYWNYGHLNLCTPAIRCTNASHKKYASDNMATEGKEVLITWSLPKIWTKWNTPLQCSEQFWWSSQRLVCAFRIWLVAWVVDSLEFSLVHGQAPFQGGRNVHRAAFSDHVQVSHDYYLLFINQITIGNDHYLEVYHNVSSKTKGIHIPWDPGKSVLRHLLKLRLGDKPNFKEGGMLGTYSTATCTWAGLLGRHMGHAQRRPSGPARYIYLEGENARAIQVGSGERHGGSSLPPRL